MKKFWSGMLLFLLLTGCVPVTPEPQHVLIEVTRVVEVVREITPPAPSPAPVNPGDASSAMLFPADCLTRQPEMDYQLYDWLNINTVGGCSYLAPSPDGRYLAFSTRLCTDSGVCGDAVKVLAAGEVEAVTIQFVPAEKRWVDSLGWSANGKLVVSYNNINSGAGVYIFSEPFVEKLEPGEAVLTGGLRQWNAARTAFVTFGAIGHGFCHTQFGGYDFTTEKAFPDVAASLGFDPEEVNILPVDSSYTSTNWWVGGDDVLLLISPLKFDAERQDSFYQPTIAGKISLTENGPIYTTVASSPVESYFFSDDAAGFTARPRAYTVRYCNE